MGNIGSKSSEILLNNHKVVEHIPAPETCGDKNGFTVNGNRLKNYLSLARGYQAQQFFEKAKETLLKALEQMPDHPRLLARLAHLYLQNEMYSEALEVTERLLTAHNNLSFPVYFKGWIHEKLGETSEAMDIYRLALKQRRKDIAVLKRLLPLLIESGDPGQALELIGHYRKMLNSKNLFTGLEAEALFASHRPAEAFKKMRMALVENPINARLLKRYLQLSIHGSNKNPLILYRILRETIPNLAGLNDNDLLELELDYLVSRHKLQEAAKMIDRRLRLYPANFYWRKRRIKIQKMLGNLSKNLDELKILFLYNPEDVEIREMLAAILIENNDFVQWKKIVLMTRKINLNNGNLNRYLRDIVFQQNWLAHSSLDFNSFVQSLTSLKLNNPDLLDSTYKKLPGYMLETLIMHICTEDKIPQPEALWEEIGRFVQMKSVPIQLQDVQAAYPVWLYALQFYFLFKSFSQYRCYFNPGLFQNEMVPLIVELNDLRIHFDLSAVLNGEGGKRRVFVKKDGSWHWRWPKSVQPKGFVSGIPIYSGAQFKRNVSEMNSLLNEVIRQND